MGKRFRETNITREPWYRKLSLLHKATWNFLCDECDAAGVWEIDDDVIELYIGEPVNVDEFISKVNNGKIRVERFGEHKIFIPGFIEFQYGELSENCIPHRKIIALLNKYNLLDRVQIRVPDRVQSTLQEKEEDKDMEGEKEMETPARKKRERLKISGDAKADQPEQEAQYQQIVLEINEGLDVPMAWSKIRDFINEKRPHFAEPYVDVWNIFADKNSLAKVGLITENRKAKIRTRTREPAFDFMKILEAIKKNEFYLGRQTDWKVDFDHIIHSQDNYVKILERKS